MISQISKFASPASIVLILFFMLVASSAIVMPTLTLAFEGYESEPSEITSSGYDAWTYDTGCGDCSDWAGDLDYGYDSGWGNECCDDGSSAWGDCCNDGWGNECCDDPYGGGCDNYCGGESDGCYDYCGGDDGCNDYCGNDYDGCDYSCDDYNDYDACDWECDEFYEEEVSDTYQTDSSGARYSSSASSPSFSMPRFANSAPSYSSAPMRIANSAAPSFSSQPIRQNPVYIPNQPAPVFQATPVSNNTIITTTNVDNSITDNSFNYADYSINDSFNNYNSNNTAVAIGGTWGTVTPIAAVTPGYTVAAVIPSYTPTYVPHAPIYRANPQYVALSQIPYTGFDFGPVGNAIYWMSLMSIAAAGAYLLIYFKGGALSFAGFLMPRRSTALKARTHDELPVLPTISEKKVVANSTKDTMTVSDKGIVINRSY